CSFRVFVGCDKGLPSQKGSVCVCVCMVYVFVCVCVCLADGHTLSTFVRTERADTLWAVRRQALGRITFWKTDSPKHYPGSQNLSFWNSAAVLSSGESTL